MTFSDPEEVKCRKAITSVAHGMKCQHNAGLDKSMSGTNLHTFFSSTGSPFMIYFMG